MNMLDEAMLHAREMGIDPNSIFGNELRKKRKRPEKQKPIKVTCICGNSFKHRPNTDYGDGILRHRTATCKECGRSI